MKYIKMVLQTLKVFVLFTGCTILFYYAIMWLTEEYQNQHRYDEPDGEAVRVVSTSVKEENHWYDRLILFYLNGE
jgi:hypothetical protein